MLLSFDSWILMVTFKSYHPVILSLLKNIRLYEHPACLPRIICKIEMVRHQNKGFYDREKA